MQKVTVKDLSNLYIPPTDSHKGQNGRVLLVGGSRLFHAASLWALKVSSRIVDLVHYASVAENNKIVSEIKKEFRDGIVIPRSEIESYIEEDDVVLIGPGMVRAEGSRIQNSEFRIQNLKDVEKIKNEGIQTAVLTNYLLDKYPQKKWVIDAGALQMMDIDLIPNGSILTPHHKEFHSLKLKIKNEKLKIAIQNKKLEEQTRMFAKEYDCIVLLKGKEDIVSDGERTWVVEEGNAGMTKGGTGDVLAGLVAALFAKNPPLLSANAASFINKTAGDELYKSVGPYFNASDLADQIPRTMKRLLM